MKKLYASKNPNKRIHPSPLSFLPSALMALASALSPDDQLVLSYLLTSHSQQQQRVRSQNQNQNRDDRNHSPDLGCSCFSCYKSFWARWDSSPDRHVIHTILDAFEEEETLKYPKKKDSKGRSKRKAMKVKREEEEEGVAVGDVQEIDHAHHQTENEKTHDDAHDDGHDEKEEGDEKGSVRRFFGWVFGIND